MSLQPTLLLFLLFTWLNGKASPMRLIKNLGSNRTSSHVFQRSAKHSVHNFYTLNGDRDKSHNELGEQYAGGSVKKQEHMNSLGLKMYEDSKWEETDLSISLDCDEQTKLALSGPQSHDSPGFLSQHILESCGKAVSTGPKNMTVLVKECDVTLANGRCSTKMKYETVDGQLADVTLPCAAHRRDSSSNHHTDLMDFGLQSDSPHARKEFKCVIPTRPRSERCKIDPNQRIPCGSRGISSSECSKKGCCYNHSDGVCLYPVNECTPDKHFVFAVYRNHSNFLLDLTRLKTSGASSCQPKILTKTFAVFFFPTTACGVRTYNVGASTVFSVEVLTSLSPVPAISGNISRDLQFRLMVECRYAKGPTTDPSYLVSAGFMVKSPSVYPMVLSEGLFRVQLRIAKDAGYKRFHPSYHQPLRVLLGDAVYLEVGIDAPSPNPAIALLVHYCIAYPKSATKALVLLHDGCPNPSDYNGVVLIRMPGNKYVRHFKVNAFQFMVAPDEYLDEQIYFLCSTELCFHWPCREGCFAAAP